MKTQIKYHIIKFLHIHFLHEIGGEGRGKCQPKKLRESKKSPI